ncbi:AMP-binding protein [Amycolatopsis pigmentata]|uniref:AMP-binding protein n=2 Tax=Amycolatopsis pigmentata TaxID=450801 RepID=A0ABW5FQH7_9PSEU
MVQQLLDGDTIGASLANLARASPQSRATFPESRETITATELDEAATNAAARFVRAGLAEELVGVLVDTNPMFFVTLFGLWRAGAALSVLPATRVLGGVDRTTRQLATIMQAASMRFLVTDQNHAEIAGRLTELMPGLMVVQVGELTDESSSALPAVKPDRLAVVQFTSGSTSAPKGVMLTHRTVMAGLAGCVVSGQFSRNDVFVQWVPTFHDMGLIGLLSHWLNGADVHVFTPSSFLRHPAKILTYFGEHGGTVLTGPNFSYDQLLDSISSDQLANFDLSHWRLAFNGAEPVNPDTVTRFTEKFAAAGVAPSVMYPVYGMAEATLAVSFPDPGSVARVVDVDRASLNGDGVRIVDSAEINMKKAVSVGRPVHGIEVRIADAPNDGTKLGEIEIRGDAVTTGYYGNHPANQVQFTSDSWLRTGDLGFFLDGELFVMGRSKEMIVVHGQNFFPEDVESIVREIPDIYRKRCVAFPVIEGYTERMGIIAEVPSTVSPDVVRREILSRVSAELSLAHIDINLVEPRWLTRTTSGKWQRSIAAHRITASRKA